MILVQISDSKTTMYHEICANNNESQSINITMVKKLCMFVIVGFSGFIVFHAYMHSFLFSELSHLNFLMCG